MGKKPGMRSSALLAMALSIVACDEDASSGGESSSGGSEASTSGESMGAPEGTSMADSTSGGTSGPGTSGTSAVGSTTGESESVGESSTSGAALDECHVLDVDFSRSPLGPYNVETMVADFDQGGNAVVTDDHDAFRWPLDDDGNALYAHIVEDEGNQVLRLTLGDLGVFPNRAFNVVLGTPLEAATLRYRFRLADSADSQFQGAYKIPRLAGRADGAAEYLHSDPDPDGPGGEPTVGYTVAMQLYGPSSGHSAHATPFAYAYHSEQQHGDIGDQIFFPTNVTVTGGDWHDIELYVRMNTRGCADDCDGVFAISLDGEEIYRSEEWRFTDTEDLSVNRFFFLAQSNNEENLAEYVDFDDFTVDCAR